MVRSKKETTPVEDIDVFDMDFGGAAVKLSDSTVASIEDWVPTMVPQIDALTSGGLPLGKVVAYSSDEGLGKTTLAIKVTQMAQRTDELVSIWIDLEASASKERMRELGVDPNKVLVITPDNSSVDGQAIEMIVGQVVTVVEKLAKVGKRALIVWDSLAQSVALAELDKEQLTKQLGVQAKAIQSCCKTIFARVQAHGATMIMINQLRENVSTSGMPGPKDKLAGGKYPKYISHQIIKLKKGPKNLSEGAENLMMQLTKNRSGATNIKEGYSSLGAIGPDPLYNFWEILKTLTKAPEVRAHAKVEAQSITFLDPETGEIIEKMSRPVYNELAITATQILDPAMADEDDYEEQREAQDKIYGLVRPGYQALLHHMFPNGYPAFHNKNIRIHHPLLEGYTEEGYDENGVYIGTGNTATESEDPTE